MDSEREGVSRPIISASTMLLEPALRVKLNSPVAQEPRALVLTTIDATGHPTIVCFPPTKDESRMMKPKSPLCNILLAATALVLAGCNNDQSEDATTMTAPNEPAGVTTEVALPNAEKRPHEMVEHGHRRNDEYFWLRDDDRKDPDVIAYLDSENAYTEAMLADTEAFKNSLYEEMVARIKQDDSSVPAQLGDYWYYSSFSEGQEYPVYARHKGSAEGLEEVILDVNALAEGHDYFNVGSYEVSDNDQLLAWS